MESLHVSDLNLDGVKIMNGINYQFTQKEIEALSDVLQFIRMNCGDKEKSMAEIVAIALNRNAFNEINEMRQLYD